MAFRDRFPTLEDLLRASAEDVGAELVLHMQQRRPQQVHEGNLISDLMHLYGAGQQGTPPELLVVIAEAVAWARRALLVVNDLTQSTSSGWMVLSRAGQEFTRETVNQLRLRELLPDFMLHPAIRTTCLSIFRPLRVRRCSKPSRRWRLPSERRQNCRSTSTAGPWSRRRSRPMAERLPTRQSISRSVRHCRCSPSGAVGYFKNPRSHRRTDLSDAQAADP